MRCTYARAYVSVSVWVVVRHVREEDTNFNGNHSNERWPIQFETRYRLGICACVFHCFPLNFFYSFILFFFFVFFVRKKVNSWKSLKHTKKKQFEQFDTCFYTLFNYCSFKFNFEAENSFVNSVIEWIWCHRVSIVFEIGVLIARKAYQRKQNGFRLRSGKINRSRIEKRKKENQDAHKEKTIHNEWKRIFIEAVCPSISI